MANDPFSGAYDAGSGIDDDLFGLGAGTDERARRPPLDQDPDIAPALGIDSTPAASPAHDFPPITAPAERGPLRTLWEQATSPLRAIAGVTGTSLVHATGVPWLFPETYEKAKAENVAAGKGRAGPDILNEAADLPGFGDVAAAALPDEFKSSTAGRILTPVGRLGLNILGDPATYTGAGVLPRLTRVGAAAADLGKVQRAIEELELAGRGVEAADLVAQVPGLAGKLADAAGSESAVGRGARSILDTIDSLGGHAAGGEAIKAIRTAPDFSSAARGVGRLGLTLPFGPIPAIAYAPDLAEGVAGGISDTYENARQGRYAEAAASGTGLLLTTGLSLMVGRGLIDEAHAASVLERELGEQLGEKTKPGMQPPPAAGDVRAPQQPPMPEPTAGPAQGPPPTPAVAPDTGVPPPPGGPPVEGGGVAASAAAPVETPIPTIAPTPGSERIKIEKTPQALQQLTTLVGSKVGEGQYLTKRDLVDSGLVTPKQAKSYSLEALIDAIGGTQLRARLEPVAGYGFRVRDEAPIAAPANVGAPAGEPAEGAAAAGVGPVPLPVAALPQPPPNPSTAVIPPAPERPPREVPPLAAPEPKRQAIAPEEHAATVQALRQAGVSEPTTPPPSTGTPSITHAEIDKQLKNPEALALVDQALAGVAKDAGKKPADVNRADIAAAFPGDANKVTRATLYRVTEARRKIAKIQAQEQAQTDALGVQRGEEPSAMLTFPGEDRLPNRTYREFDAEGKPIKGGTHVAEGIHQHQIERTFEEEARAAAAAETGIGSHAEYIQARNTHDQVEAFQRARPELAHELEPQRAELAGQLDDAESRGLHLERTQPQPQAPIVHPDLATITTPPALEDVPHATRAAIGQFIATTKIKPETFVARAEQLLGKKLDDANGDELNLVYTMAERQPQAFGAPEPHTRLDPQLTAQATERLIGGTKHTGQGGEREFAYDPSKPAGKVQAYARAVEARYGIPAEGNLQQTLVRWISGLSEDDHRFVDSAVARARTMIAKGTEKAAELEKAGRVTEAVELRSKLVDDARTTLDRGEKRFNSARNLRRLLLAEPDDVKAGSELERLLRSDVLNKSRNYVKLEGSRMRPIDNLIARSGSEGLDDKEAARFAYNLDDDHAAVDELAETAPAAIPGIIGVRPRPEGVTPADWLAQIRGDEKLRMTYLESLASVARSARESQAGKGTTQTTDHIVALRQIADAVGFSIPKKEAAARTIKKLARLLKPEEAGPPNAVAAPSAASVSELLNDARVSARGPAWDRAIARTPEIRDARGRGTGARVVDFEDDAPGIARAFHQVAAPLVDPLARTTSEISAITDMPSRFGGFTVSPQLNGLRMGSGDIYVNPLHARLEAESSLAGTKLTGDAHAQALDYRTAQNLVDTTIHEIAHTKARHDAASGDKDFIAAYADAIRSLGPRYQEFVRSVRDEIAPTFRTLEPLSKDYAAAVDRMGETRDVSSSERAGSTGGTQGSDLGPGQGGAAAVAARPGGDTGSAVDGAEPRLRPLRPIPPGGVGAAEGAAARAAAGEGVAGVGAGERVEGRGAGEAGASGSPAPAAASPTASLTSQLGAHIEDRNRRETMDRITKQFALTYSKYSGRPEDADRLLKTIETLRSAPDALKEALRTATPGADRKGGIDVGANLRKFAGDAMSDAQKEELGLALVMRNSELSRSKPMTVADVHGSFAKILENHTPEQFIDMAKVKGLNDPADFAFLETVAATFARDVDSGRASLRAAQIEADGARRSGDQAALQAATDRMAAAHDLIAQSVFKRDSAIFTLIPESTRTARNLAFRRMMFHPLTPEETFKSRFFGAMRASGIKAEKQQQFYQMLHDTIAQGPAADWSGFINAFRQATEPKYFDKFLEFWKAGLLGLPTQITNFGTNLGFLGLRNAELAVSNLAGRAFSSLTGSQKTRFAGETSARAFGGRVGLKEAWGALKSDLSDISHLRTVDPSARMNQGTFFDDPNLRQVYGAISGKKGEFIRTPFKLLDTFDNFFKHIIRNQEWAAQSHRLAQDPRLWSHSAEGAQHATSRIFDELRRVAADPIGNQGLWKKQGYQEALKAGRDAAVTDTFQEPLVGNPIRNAAHSYQRATNQLPALQLLTPFMKTPYNILAEAMKRTPIAGAWTIKKYLRGEITNEHFVEDMVKSSVGTALMGTVFQAAVNDQITGAGPNDPKEVELLKRTGWQPRSIKIGDTYYSYQRLAPLSILMGAAADMAEAYKRKDIETVSDKITRGVTSVNQNVLDQSFLTGVSNLVDILSDPERKGATAFRQLEASLVPNTIGIIPFANAARAIDPTYRETEAFTASPLIAQIPFASKTLPEQRTPTGEVRQRKGTPFERLFSPIQRSETETGPIAEAAGEIARVGPAVSAPPLYFKVGDDKVYYTPDEREQLARAQEAGFNAVAQLIRRPEYKSLPDSELVGNAGQRTKRDAIQTVIGRYRDNVQNRINREALRRAKADQHGGS